MNELKVKMMTHGSCLILIHLKENESIMVTLMVNEVDVSLYLLLISRTSGALMCSGVSHYSNSFQPFSTSGWGITSGSLWQMNLNEDHTVFYMCHGGIPLQYKKVVKYSSFGLDMPRWKPVT
jgi:hypothetical protein